MKKKLVAAIATTAIALTVSGGAVASADDHMGRKGGEKITSLLSTLVANGTITQSQADAITKAAEDARAAGKAKFDKDRAALDSIITSTLGISLDTLKTRIKAGETLAAIAGDKKDALINALIAEINKQIDAAVSAGKLTAAQATAQKAKTTERVSDMVNNLKPMGHKGGKAAARA
jgi:polyhydroxyalkanoate synthesis regulator phasin